MSLRRGAPWGTLDLSDGTTVSVIGVQGSDGDRARARSARSGRPSRRTPLSRAGSRRRRTSARSRVRSRVNSSSSSRAHCSQWGAKASPSRSRPRRRRSSYGASTQTSTVCRDVEPRRAAADALEDQQRHRLDDHGLGELPGDPVVAAVAARTSLAQRVKQLRRAARRRAGARPAGEQVVHVHDRAPSSNPAATASARVRLAGAGRTVEAQQPTGAEASAGAARAGQDSCGVVTRPAEAAVGRHRLDDLAHRRPGGRGWCARRARRTWRAGTRPSRRSGAGAAPEPVSGVWTSPAPSSPVRCRPGGAQGSGARSLPVGPLAMNPPPATVTTPSRGSTYDRDAEERRRPRLEALVVVEQAGHQQPGAGGDLGDDAGRRRSTRRCRSRRRSRTPGPRPRRAARRSGPVAPPAG